MVGGSKAMRGNPEAPPPADGVGTVTSNGFDVVVVPVGVVSVTVKA